jgi:hypothetical protein
MRRSTEEPETTLTVKKRLGELKTQHAKDMECLYAYYAQVYRQEQEELRASSDCTVSQDQDDPAFLAESIALDVILFRYRKLFISIMPRSCSGTLQKQSTLNQISAGVRRCCIPHPLFAFANAPPSSEKTGDTVRSIPRIH